MNYNPTRPALTHTAAPLDPDNVLRCATCRAVLKDFNYREGSSLCYGLEYQAGSLVMVWDGYQALAIGEWHPPMCDAVEPTNAVYDAYKAHVARFPGMAIDLVARTFPKVEELEARLLWELAQQHRRTA